MSSITRRDFFQSATAAAVLASAVRLRASSAHLPLGLQLYSVRELLPKDFDGTLALVRSAGYTEVEAAGYFNRSAAEFRHSMDQAGLRCISTHHTMAALEPSPDALIDYAHKLGLEYVICSWPERRDPAAQGKLNLDDWHSMADKLNAIGGKVKAAGMTFGYHNHLQEFGTENGVVFYDELLRLTDPALVAMEMDCGWVAAAGRNPLDYLAKTPNRFPLLHVKDIAKSRSGEMHSVILGTGVIDYRPILHAATGLKHAFIEQEEFELDTIESLRQDAAYMRKIGF